jgi:hypothetical protein
MNIDVAGGEFAGDCMFYVPLNHVKFMIENCGMILASQHPDGVTFVHGLGDLTMDLAARSYNSSSADLLIMYLSWLLQKDGEQEIEVVYSNPFWAIHDFEHALNDESGCTIYVDEHIEYQRIEDTFRLMKEHGHEITWEILEEVTEAYNQRFGLTGSKAKSFEHHFEFEVEEEADFVGLAGVKWNLSFFYFDTFA